MARLKQSSVPGHLPRCIAEERTSSTDLAGTNPGKQSSGATVDGLSILVPTRNRPAMLAQCLESLERVATRNTEIIVIDQSDEPARVRELSRGDRAQRRILRVDGEGKSRALNAGLAACRHGLIAAVDDDITVDGDWLARGIQLMQQRPEIDLAFGLVRAAPHVSSDVFVPEFLPGRSRVIRARRQLHLPLTGMGANMFIRRAALEAVGGWDPSRGPGGASKSGDDWDLAYRVLRTGGRIYVTPEIGVTHWGARNYADGMARSLISRNYYGLGYGLAQYARRGDLFALGLLGRAVCEVAGLVVWNASRIHRPVGIRRLNAVLSGAFAGFAPGQSIGPGEFESIARTNAEDLQV